MEKMEGMKVTECLVLSCLCPDLNYGNMYFNCSNVCEVASGLLTPRGRHNWTEV